MEDKKTIRIRIISIVLLVFALYLTVLSPFSGRAVAAINGGYGTFDMKKYDADVFANVMNATSDVNRYWKYYICDFIFTAAFLNFMIQMVSRFKGVFINKVKMLSYVLAVTRGMLDTSENIILLNQIYSYPEIDRILINTCNVITRLKFLFMRGWFICFLVMRVLTWINKGGKDKERGASGNQVSDNVYRKLQIMT